LGEKSNAYWGLMGNLKGIVAIGRSGHEWENRIKIYLIAGRGLYLAGYGKVKGFCEDDNEALCSKKKKKRIGEFLDYLSDCFSSMITPRIYFVSLFL
jgi:hypothetical protein